jgi:hypothetical protein
VDTLHAEQLVLRSNRPGRLHTHVVCPGVLYGAGEADDQLHGLWNLAWEGQQPLQVMPALQNMTAALELLLLHTIYCCVYWLCHHGSVTPALFAWMLHQ